MAHCAVRRAEEQAGVVVAPGPPSAASRLPYPDASGWRVQWGGPVGGGSRGGAGPVGGGRRGQWEAGPVGGSRPVGGKPPPITERVQWEAGEEPHYKLMMCKVSPGGSGSGLILIKGQYPRRVFLNIVQCLFPGQEQAIPRPGGCVLGMHGSREKKAARGEKLPRATREPWQMVCPRGSLLHGSCALSLTSPLICWGGSANSFSEATPPEPPEHATPKLCGSVLEAYA